MGLEFTERKLGLQDVVSAMLGWKISLVYLPTGSEK